MSELSKLYSAQIQHHENLPKAITRSVELSPVPPEELAAVVEAIVDGLIKNIDNLEFDIATTTVSELQIGKQGERHPNSRRNLAVAALEGRSHDPKRMMKREYEVKDYNTKLIPEISLRCIFRVDSHIIAQKAAMEAMLRNVKNLNDLSSEMVGKRLTEKLGGTVEYSVGSIAKDFRVLMETPAGVKGTKITPEMIQKDGPVMSIAKFMRDFAKTDYGVDDVNWSGNDDEYLGSTVFKRRDKIESNVFFQIFVDAQTSVSDNIFNQRGNNIYINCNQNWSKFKNATLLRKK